MTPEICALIRKDQPCTCRVKCRPALVSLPTTVSATSILNMDQLSTRQRRKLKKMMEESKGSTSVLMSNNACCCPMIVGCTAMTTTTTVLVNSVAPSVLSPTKSSSIELQKKNNHDDNIEKRTCRVNHGKRSRFEKKQLLSTMKHVFTEDFMVQITLDNSFRFMESLMNEFKPCFITNQFIDYKIHMTAKSLANCSNSEQFNRLTRNITMGGLTILNEPNAGGTSLYSEVLSFEMMNKCFGARLDKTEMEIEYFPYGSKKTDFSVLIQDEKVGVSVTRAFQYAENEPFTELQAQVLLRKKLFGVLASTENVVRRHRWKKQILHIWTPSMNVARVLHTSYKKIERSLRANTMVVVTIAPHVNCVFTEKAIDHNPIAVKHTQTVQKRE